MRSRSILLGAVLVLAGLTPLASAYHMSVGNYDSVGTSPEETVDAPTVEPGAATTSRDNVQPDPDGNLYERGLVTDCYEVDGNETGTNAASELPAAAAADPICGRLVYNAGTGFDTRSPLDQDVRLDGWSFDVQHTSYVGAFSLSACDPWCDPGGQALFNNVHMVGNQAGLTDNASHADEHDGEHYQTYSPALLLPQATTTATQESGAYEGNGWLFPYQDQSMMGFLTDGQGDMVSDEELADRVSSLKESDMLPESAVPTVCGFTPDDTITIDAPQIGFCEVAFEFNSDGESLTDGEDFRPEEDEDYNDPCASPTYVCGANQPAWYAQKVCNNAASEECPTTPGVCRRLPGAAPCTEELEKGDGFESTRDYDIWHWVVAPSPPHECQNVKEPGFLTDAGAGFAHPYIAHDLDIYVTPTGPAAETSGASELQATEHAEHYAVTVADNARSGVPSVPGLPEVDATSQVAKDDTVEPNAKRVDNSQGPVNEARSLGDNPCAALVESSETVPDPWVNIIDNQMTRDLVGDVGTGPGDAKDPYLTSADHQDASNRPGPSLYFTEGKVGVFTDKNDDGDYDQVVANDMFSEIQSAGAYPMFWDMRVDSDGEPAPSKGCSQGFAQKTLTEQMVNAGYGPHTGLVQVVYLTHPTAMVYYPTNGVATIQQPNTAIVFKSEGLEALWNQEDATTQSLVQQAVDKLPEEPAQVVHAADLVEPEKDFFSQCGESTGGFTSAWGFVHAAQLGSGGDTIVTEYVFENEGSNEGVIGGAGDIPALTIGGMSYAFETGINQWFDLDPIDNDPSRNAEEDGSPPH